MTLSAGLETKPAAANDDNPNIPAANERMGINTCPPTSLVLHVQNLSGHACCFFRLNNQCEEPCTLELQKLKEHELMNTCQGFLCKKCKDSVLNYVISLRRHPSLKSGCALCASLSFLSTPSFRLSSLSLSLPLSPSKALKR